MHIEIPGILVDGVQSISIHNGIARIVFIRLDEKNKGQPVLELFVPVIQMGMLTKALQQ